MSTTSNPLLEAKGITKYFGTITALENVNLKVHAGECLGVVGDNGAGKSTLMKVLSGLYKPSSGALFFQGKEEILESPRDSQNLGLEMVYQDLALAGNLPIGENIFYFSYWVIFSHRLFWKNVSCYKNIAFFNSFY